MPMYLSSLQKLLQIAWMKPSNDQRGIIDSLQLAIFCLFMKSLVFLLSVTKAVMNSKMSLSIYLGEAIFFIYQSLSYHRKDIFKILVIYSHTNLNKIKFIVCFTALVILVGIPNYKEIHDVTRMKLVIVFAKNFIHNRQI